MNSQFKNGIVLGLALFAMFFGAGNLIFPTSVGLNAGNNWFLAMLGFLATGVGLPLLGVFSVIKIGGTLKSFSKKLGGIFSNVYGVTVITSLALVAISRTAATTFEMSIQPLVPDFSPVISSIIFFAITLVMVINPSGIIDRIGKILTPVLLTMLSIIIVKGIIDPIGNPVHALESTPFSNGFFGGYQTMDALGSVILGGIIIGSLIEKGYTDKVSQRKVARTAILIAGAGLAAVYGGLLYLGATSSGVLSADLSRTDLTIQIVQLVLGNTGKIILGICVAFACLTTSVGLTATVGDYYQDLTKNKINYKAIVILVSVLCAIISNFGVDTIVSLATPLLIAIYPVTIVLIVLNLLSDRIPPVSVRASVIGAFSVSLFDGLKAINITIDQVDAFIQQLPLADQNFAWISPALLGLVIGYALDFANKPKSTTKPKNRKAIKAT